MQPHSIHAWRSAEAAARAGPHAARSAFGALLSNAELELPARLKLATLDLQEGAVRAATAQALAACRLPESDPLLLLGLARQLFDLGEVEAGLGCLRSPAVQAARDPAVHFRAARMLCDLSFYDLALDRLERAKATGPSAPQVDYLLGMARMYCGREDAAEDALEACLRADPGFAPALRLLSMLRRQTAARNHVDRLRLALSRLGEGHAYAPLLHYALFKELDDLDDPDAAWPHLERGMQARRAQVGYDEQADIRLFDALMRWRPAGSAAAAELEGPVPLFVVGMPRSGTTLLERLLAGDPRVADAGELRDFVCQLRWCCDRLGGPHPDAGLVEAAQAVDLAELGRRYMAHTAWRAGGKACFTDKLPANFLLAGPIAAALPRARILHMGRDPMDSCFSNLKALFAGAYPHSYSQEEMARHFLRYRRLMQHWDAQSPGRILHVRYEALVSDPDAEARRVFGFCGLSWKGKPAATAGGEMVGTASTVQVREPIHRRYMGQWRRYGRHLGPLQEALGEAADPESTL